MKGSRAAKLLKQGSKVIINSLDYSHCASKRLVDMGITPGCIISLRRIAPLGDPYIFNVRNYQLAIRKKDLAAADMDLID
jgi:Fe2+ transport system protein FeoA